jgi:hypothetical protein
MRLLPHLIEKDRALAKFNHILRAGGTAIFDFWNRKSFVGLGRMLLMKSLESPIFYVDYKTMLRLISKAGFRVIDSYAWGYPRIGRFSMDALGNRLMKQFGYSVVFNVKKI